MELLNQEFRYKSRVTEILPNTKRTLERRQKQLAEEQQKKREQENLQKAQEEQQKQIKQMLREKELRQKLEEERKREEERKNQEELQSINTLKGEFGNMINDLKSDQSKLDYTISGLDLRPVQIRILLKVAETNNTLKGLVMSRKKISDEDGVELVNSLQKNIVLERFELEGNLMGPRTVHAIAQLLSMNKSIRVLDLESNNLTNLDSTGIVALGQALKSNDTLLSLNMNNCNLDEVSGEALTQALEENETLIMMDVENNPKMKLEDVRRIQELLKRNKKAYDDERYREFIERKRMGNEEQISSILLIKREEKVLAADGINKRIEARKSELEKIWQEEHERKQQEQQKLVAKLAKEAEQRKGKKKRRGPPKKK